MAIELYFGINFLIDGILVWACARICQRVLPVRRIFLCAAVGALIASLATIPACAFLSTFIGKCLTVPGLMLLAFGKTTGKLLLKRSFLFVALSALCAGIASALVYAGYDAISGSLCAAAALVACAFARPRVPLRDCTVPVTVSGQRFVGLIDTGNRLVEPRSGACCIVANDALYALGDRECPRAVLLKTAAGSAIVTAYALRDVIVEYGGEKIRIPLTWVCRSPQVLQDGLEAILPPWPLIEGSYEYEMDQRSA